ncbi:EAL domain-containing protein [Azospira restricta]|uniref:EAL domain-containing protein n=1 Tax=Azospira restricta TaxID=404405 RepID=A0A974PX50_9RHOO|nr:EAL domain-containing protein [Azospira restricta]QRJ62615.1 EAL domain-containing protein [Azospira restricta]
MPATHPNDELNIIDDLAHDAPPAKTIEASPWRILVVDDDPEVHNATAFALQDIRIDGRPLSFIHAYSADEALAAIVADEDIAVVLLDVVMEHESAGLDLVRTVRQDLGRSALRIILRTGQPGYAPEMRVIREYDINDYKTKSELTRVRLLTTLTTAVRSYEQLRTIMNARRGLALIVDTAADLLARRDPGDFAAAALDSACRLAGDAASGFLCARRQNFANLPGEPPLFLIGARGGFADRLGRPLADCGAAGAFAARAYAEHRTLVAGSDAAFFIAGENGRDAVLYLHTGAPLGDSGRQLLEVFCVNIGVGLENAGLIADLSFSAFTDRLTRLANRSGFVARIDEHLRSGGRGWTVALLDIDHFSELNDALGHHKGDQLLLSVAQRLSAMLSPGMILARVGGDVFGLLGPDAALDPRLLLDQFKLPFLVDDYSLPVKATLGLTRLDEVSNSDGIDLLKATNIALNRAKSGDRGRWHYYTEDMARETRTRLDRLHELRIAVTQQRGLELHYQPQIELVGGRLVGAEALIRWRGADGEFIRPDLFISLAEYSGLIVDLGAWVFHTAVRQLRDWEAAGLAGVRMAINVSLVQFRDPLFLSRVRSALAETGVAPERIELEITESVAMMEAETVIGILAELKQMGIQIAIDDFGTGFSSLAYLHRLPIDRIKIDRAFVRDLDSTSGSGASIAQTVIGLGRSLGLSIIAEGVETAAQAQLLMDLGCPLAQGFFYSRPVDAGSFLAWAQARA